MKFLSILLFVLCGFNSYSQVTREWVKRYNGPANRFDIATTMKLDGSSGVIVYGNVTSAVSFSDITAIKYSASGNMLWQASFNGYGNSVDECKSAIMDSNGNSYITGFTADTGQVIKIVTLKLNNSGDVLWSHVFLPPAYNQGMGISVVRDQSGNIYTCGNLRRTNGTNTIVILKYSDTGNLLNTALFNFSSGSSETPVSACTDNAGNIYVLASTNVIGGQIDLLILKYNSSLSFSWQKIISGSAPGNDIPVQMLLSNDNKLVIAASVNNNSGGLDYGIYRLDTSSAMLMQYFYNGTGDDQDYPYAITSDAANNIYVTGSSRNYDTLGSEDFYTMKLSPAGSLLWGRRYNGTGRGFDYGTSIDVDNLGNVFIGGTTDKHDFHQQYALLKYGPTGDLHWLEEYSRIEYSEDFIYTTLADNNGSVYVTGISFDSTSDYDIATIKYSEPIGIIQISNEVPKDFQLFQNYPNPFNPVTKIKFSIPSNVKSEKSNVILRVYNIAGELITTLINSELLPGIYEADLDGSSLSSGIYFCKFSYGVNSKSIKIMLLK